MHKLILVSHDDLCGTVAHKIHESTFGIKQNKMIAPLRCVDLADMVMFLRYDPEKLRLLAALAISSAIFIATFFMTHAALQLVLMFWSSAAVGTAAVYLFSHRQLCDLGEIHSMNDKTIIVYHPAEIGPGFSILATRSGMAVKVQEIDARKWVSPYCVGGGLNLGGLNGFAPDVFPETIPVMRVPYADDKARQPLKYCAGVAANPPMFKVAEEMCENHEARENMAKMVPGVMYENGIVPTVPGHSDKFVDLNPDDFEQNGLPLKGSTVRDIGIAAAPPVISMPHILAAESAHLMGGSMRGGAAWN